jgi:hypothetical protein
MTHKSKGIVFSSFSDKKLVKTICLRFFLQKNKQGVEMTNFGKKRKYNECRDESQQTRTDTIRQ